MEDRAVHLLNHQSTTSVKGGADMFDQLTKYADAPARALMAVIFILAGVGKIGATGFSVDQFLAARKGA